MTLLEKLLAPALIALCPILPASAASLPAPSITLQTTTAYGGTHTASGVGTLTSTDTFNGAMIGTSTASASLGSDTMTSARVTAPVRSGGGGGNISATSSLTYSFEVNGPAGTVPIDFSATINAYQSASAANFGADGDVTFVGPSLFYTASACVGTEFGGTYSDGCVSRPGALTSTNDIQKVFTVTTNIPYRVGLYSSAYGYDIGTALDVGAPLDPVISLDPSVSTPSLYSLIFSPGISAGVVPTPEPASLAVVGVVLAGFLAFRARSARTPA